MAKSKKSGKKPKTTPVKEEKLSEKTKKVEKKTDTKKTVKAEKAETKKVEAKAEKVEAKAEPVEEKKIVSEKKKGFFGKFFAKKYTTNENILTIFKDKKVYGALLGEIFGTMFITMLILTLGLYQLLYLFIVMTVIFVAVHKLSGANLNPIATIGMMATRRMTVIRGVLYLLAQVVGAWLGLTIVSLFLNASGSETELPGMTATPDGKFWVVSMIEFFGAAIIGFFYSRAQQYKRSSWTFGAMVAGGTVLALILVYIISANYFSLEGTFMLNPAVALMYQILPQSANGVGELLGGIGLALLTYVVFPAVGGVIGFYLSDASELLTEE
ncbi:aquaporin [Candidatus Saccharibacteria bacterium]|nr:aquaporin [Candidatus Saccharibacteria bacterium]